MKNEAFPCAALRDRLATLGIPREAHGARVLAGMLPVRANGAVVGNFDADAIAEALIYLIEKQIVAVPCRVERLLDFDWGAHRCHFYRSYDDLLEFLTPYFSRGLKAGEYCLWLSGNVSFSESLLASLTSAIPDFDEYAEAMEWAARDEWYLDEEGALKDTSLLLANWKQKLEAVSAAGYRGLRTAGDAGGLEARHWDGFAEYECEVNAALDEIHIKALCAYPLCEYRPQQLNDLRGCHQDVIVKGDRWWHRIATRDTNEARAVLRALQEGGQ
jgi:hypothetical protein